MCDLLEVRGREEVDVIPDAQKNKALKECSFSFSISLCSPLFCFFYTSID